MSGAVSSSFGRLFEFGLDLQENTVKIIIIHKVKLKNFINPPDDFPGGEMLIYSITHFMIQEFLKAQ